MKLFIILATLFLNITLFGQNISSQTFYSTNAEGFTVCCHSAYNVNDMLYIWNPNGVKLLNIPNNKGIIISKIPFGEKVQIIENIDPLNNWPSCYMDTLLKEPLLVITSPYIKIKYKNNIGYVFEKYLDLKSPLNIYDWTNPRFIFSDDIGNIIDNDEAKNKLFGDSIIYLNKYVSPGKYSYNYDIQAGYNNGVKIIQSNGLDERSSTTIVPYNYNNYLLILYKCFVMQKNEPSENFYYKLNNDIYTIGWRYSHEDNGIWEATDISYSFNEHGMIIRSYEGGGC